MAKKIKHRKKHVVVAGQSNVNSVSINGDDLIKQATIADLKKTTLLISLLFAIEFLIFYANLMGVGA